MSEQPQRKESQEPLKDAEYWETVRSVKEAYVDILNGEIGRPARETSDELRRELGLPVD